MRLGEVASLADIFISYRSTRRAAARFLASIFEAEGFSVWYDYWLASGADFAQQIEQELRSAKACVVLWCNEARESKWVLEEAFLAERLGSLVPVRVEDGDLPLGFSRIETVELSKWNGDPSSPDLLRLFRELHQRVGKQIEPIESARQANFDNWNKLDQPRFLEWPVVLPHAALDQDRPRSPRGSKKSLVISATIQPVGTRPVRRSSPFPASSWLFDLYPGHWDAVPSKFTHVLPAGSTPLVFTCTDVEKVLRVWNTATGDELTSVPLDGFWNADISPDGDCVALYTSTEVQMRATKDGSVLSSLKLPNKTSYHWRQWDRLGQSLLVVTIGDETKTIRRYWLNRDGTHEDLGDTAPVANASPFDVKISFSDAESERYLIGYKKSHLALAAALLDNSHNVIRSFDVRKADNFYMSFSPDGKRFCIQASDAGSLVYDSSSGEAIRSFDGVVKGRTDVHFAANDIMLFVGKDGLVSARNLHSGKSLFERKLDPPRKGLSNSCLLLGGSAILLECRGRLAILDVSTGKEIAEHRVETNSEESLRPFANGARFLRFSGPNRSFKAFELVDE